MICAFLLGIFNHCGDNWEFWVPLSLLLIPPVVLIRNGGITLRARTFAHCVAWPLACTVLMGFFWISLSGSLKPAPPIRLRDGVVYVGSGDLAGLAITSDPVVIGKHYGKRIRMGLHALAETGESRSVGMVWRRQGVSAGSFPVVPWILAGRPGPAFTDAGDTLPPRLVWLNPPPMEALDASWIEALSKQREIFIVWGVMRAGDSPEHWEQLALNHPTGVLRPLWGTGHYAQDAFVEILTATFEWE